MSDKKMLLPQELINVQNWRYAVKKFDSTKKISQETWNALEHSLILSPSSYGIQLWKFIVVQNPKILSQLREVSWNQSQVTDCSHHVVFAAKTKATEKDLDDYIADISKKRGVPVQQLEGLKKMMLGDFVNGPRAAVCKEWLAKQVYIALGNFMTSAALLGVDTCPMEGMNPKEYDRILGLEGSDYQTVVACPAGYRHVEDKYQHLAKVRFESSRLIQHI